jgi:hypothetical protein
MATPLSADRLLAALKAEGCLVREYRSWRTHNRNHKGPWGGVNGVVIHHTAGSNSLALVYHGRDGLPGPLAHAHLAKGGTLSLTGHGRANHAGSFARNAHDAVVAESATHPRPDAAETVDGNRHYYGIEIENLGNGRDPYPVVQYDQAVRWAAAICRAHGWSANSVIGHKEGTRRKIDPSFSMAVFRHDVAERLAHPAGWNPGTTPPKETNMPLTTDDLNKIFTKVWKTDAIKAPVESADNPTWMPYSFIRDNNIRLRAVQNTQAVQAAALEALAAPELSDAQVAQIATALAAHPTLTEQIAESVADKVPARVVDILAARLAG